MHDVPDGRRRPARRRRTAVLLIAVFATLLTAPALPAAASPIIIPIPILRPIATIARGIDGASSITRGPDGNMWFTSILNDSIGRMNPNGTISMFGSSLIWMPDSIVPGPDGNLWFVSRANDRIGRITPTGVISTFTSGLVHTPRGIVAGADGALWFTQSNDTIGRITTAGAITVVTAGPGVIDDPVAIIAGESNDLWFVNEAGNSIGHLIGVVGGLAAVSKITNAKISHPDSLAMGPDGNVWVTNLTGPSVLKVVPCTSGVTEYPTPAVVHPTGIHLGPNGDLWFVGLESDNVARITTLGTVHVVTGAGVAGLSPADAALGADGNEWVAHASSIARVTPLGTVTKFVTGFERVQDITTGPDGNLWVGSTWGLTRLAPTGASQRFTKAGLLGVHGVAAGPDGNVWFTDDKGKHIGRSTLNGVITLFSGPGITTPWSITAGPDGNLWFTNHWSTTIGRITPAGVVTTFTHPELQGAEDITAGPDGNLWFTDNFGEQIGRLTPAGAFTFFSTPDVSLPQAITRGHDGNLWFSNSTSVGRITTAGAITDFNTGAQPVVDLVDGADGNLWFGFHASLDNQGFGRLTPQGSVSYITKPRTDASSLTPGPDGNVWFTTSHSTVGRLTVAPQRFSDVPVGHPFYADINWVASEGIASGYADGTFRPTDPVSRQAMAAFLYRLDGSSLGSTPPCPAAPFPDVPVGAPFCGEITWLADHGIAGGYPDGGFHPTTSVSRQAMAAFLYRLAAGGTAPACTVAPFEDVAKTSTFCGEIAWASQNGIINGFSDGTFQPGKSVSRQAMAAFLHRLDIYQNP